MKSAIFAALACAACGSKVIDEPPSLLRVAVSGTATSQDIEVAAAPLPPLPCPVDERVGGCCFAPAPVTAGVADDSTPRNFGTIVVSDRSSNKTLLRIPFDPKPNGGGSGPPSGYHTWDAQPASWTPGDEIGLTVSDTELAVRSPLTIDATIPVHDRYLDAGADLVLSWTPDPHGATMRFEYTANGTSGASGTDAAYVICDVEDSSGSLTIPEARLGLTSANGTWPDGEMTLTRALAASTRLRGSEDTLHLDTQQQLFVSFQSRKTCSTNADCDERLGCRCSQCTGRDVCTTNADCETGSYCSGIGHPVPGGDTQCLTGRCDPLPPSITCGALDCQAHVMHFDSKTDLPIAPCCIAGSNACGLDVSPLIITNDKCQPFGQGDGMPDPTCPGCVGDTCNGGAIAGCRRADGKCGFALDDLGLGCVLDQLAP